MKPGGEKRYGYYWCRNERCRGVKGRKEQLENQLFDLLHRLKPSQRLESALRKGILAAWQKENADALARVSELRKTLNALISNRSELTQAFVYAKSISKYEYERENERLDSEIIACRMRLSDLEYDQLDVERLMRNAFYVLANAYRIWQAAGVEDKASLISLLFPNGLYYENGGFRTQENADGFSVFELFQTPHDSLATPTGFEPVLPA